MKLILYVGLYLDKPSRCGVELNGEYTLWDFTAYLMDNPDIVFIVFQNYSCDRVPNSRSKQNRFTKSRSGNIDPHQISPDYESIYLVSDTLRSTLIELGNCSVFEQDNLDEMIAPYLLVYHYRRQLLELAGKRQDVSRHISTLLSYIESHYKEEYDDADCKFAKGVVIPEHLTKLWIPNEVFLCNEKDHHMAYVLEKWPLRAAFDMGTTEDLELSCWLWAYNGNELYRTYTTKTISIGSHDEIRIDQLRAYPLKYSTRVSQNRLRDRGSKFWNLRRRHLIVYSGLDFYKDRTYVIYSVLPNSRSSDLTRCVGP